MKQFEIVEARWLGLNDRAPPFDPRWLLRGRALADVEVGDTFTLGNEQVLLESIQTYGKPLERLSAGVTGELTVRGLGGQSLLWLTR